MSCHGVFSSTENRVFLPTQNSATIQGTGQIGAGGASAERTELGERTMALVRCEAHGRPQGRTQVYVVGVPPVGFPQTAAICGLKGCENAGSVWLTTDEKAAYEKGQRIFEVPNAAVKIKVE